MSLFSEGVEDTYRNQTLYGSMKGRAISEFLGLVLIPLGSFHLWNGWASVLAFGILIYMDPYHDAVIAYVRYRKGIK